MMNKIIEKLTKLIGEWRYPILIKKYIPDSIDNIIENIPVGSIILTRTEGYISNCLQSLMGSYWTHSSIVIDKKNIIEAVGIGVRKASIESLIYQSDSFAILTLKNMDQKELHHIRGVACTMLDKPYDYKFDLSNNKYVYCSEIIYHCLKDIRKLYLKKRLGELSFSPQDIYNANRLFKIIYECK